MSGRVVSLENAELIAGAPESTLPGRPGGWGVNRAGTNRAVWAALKGVVARAGGQGLDANPYAHGEPEYRIWDHGWHVRDRRGRVGQGGGRKGTPGGEGDPPVPGRKDGRPGRGRARASGAVRGGRADWDAADTAVLRLYAEDLEAGLDGQLECAFFASLLHRSIPAVEVKLSRLRKVARETEGGCQGSDVR